MSEKARGGKIMPIIQRLSTAVQFSVLACMLAIVGIAQVHAAKPPPEPLACSISPADGTATEGVPITFTGSTTGGQGKKTSGTDTSLRDLSIAVC